jgi:DNA-binding NarL/FixJ family response regulator
VTVRVEIAGAGDIVHLGLRAIVSDHPDFEMVEEAADLRPDVIVYDAVAIEEDGGAGLAALVAADLAPVIVLSRILRPALAARALRLGALAHVSLEASTGEVLELLRTVASQERRPTGIHVAMPNLGAEAGLTPREIEVLSAIARGRSNKEICASYAISVNTVKSTIRSAYRKIGATTRAQAVSWCVDHGFDGWDEDEAG